MDYVTMLQLKSEKKMSYWKYLKLKKALWKQFKNGMISGREFRSKLQKLKEDWLE